MCVSECERERHTHAHMHTYAPFRSSPSLASVTTREWSRSKSDFNKSIVPATVIAALLLFPGALILVIRYFVKSSDEELDQQTCVSLLLVRCLHKPALCLPVADMHAAVLLWWVVSVLPCRRRLVRNMLRRNRALTLRTAGEEDTAPTATW